MSFIKRFFTSSAKDLIKTVGDVADEFNLSGEEKQRFQLAMETLLQKRDAKVQDSLQKELEAKQNILMAELSQGDAFTKRARPMVVYFGLVVIAINHVIAPWTAFFLEMAIPNIELPTEFWWAWSGITGTWCIGRTVEKSGKINKATRMITGSRPVPPIFE